MKELLKKCLYCNSYFPYRQNKSYCRPSCRIQDYIRRKEKAQSEQNKALTGGIA